MKKRKGKRCPKCGKRTMWGGVVAFTWPMKEIWICDRSDGGCGHTVPIKAKEAR